MKTCSFQCIKILIIIFCKLSDYPAQISAPSSPSTQTKPKPPPHQHQHQHTPQPVLKMLKQTASLLTGHAMPCSGVNPPQKTCDTKKNSLLNRLFKRPKSKDVTPTFSHHQSHMTSERQQPKQNTCQRWVIEQLAIEN